MSDFVVNYDRNRRADALGLDVLPASWGEGYDASSEDQLARTPTRTLTNRHERQQYEGYGDFDAEGNWVVSAPAVPSTILTAQEANERYGIEGKLTFDADTPEPVAEQLHRLNMEELIRQDIRRRSSAGIGADLLAGLVTTLRDPLYLGSMFVGLGGIRLAAGAGPAVSRLVTGAAEGAVGAAALEPLVLAGAKWESADYTAADSLMNITFGSVLGGGLHLGAGYIGDRFAGRAVAPPIQQTFEEMPAEHRAAVIGSAAQQIEEGRPVDIAPVVEEAIQDLERKRGFLRPHEMREQQFMDKAQEVGLTQEQTKALLPADVRDSVTGFYRAEDRTPTIERAQEYTRATGQPSVYVEADIANLGGLNARFGNSGANRLYREMAQMLESALQESGGLVVPVRHGGDEVSAIVVGAGPDAVERALSSLPRKTADMEARYGIQDLPHAKEPGKKPPGTRWGWGVSRIDADRSLSDIISEADTVVEQKKLRTADVIAREVEASRAAAFGEQSDGTITGSGGQAAGNTRPNSATAKTGADWAKQQAEPYVAPEIRAGMDSAAEAAKMEPGAPKDLDAEIRAAEEDLADIDSRLSDEDIATFDAEPEEGTPTAKDIEAMEAEQVAYENSVKQAANCLTGR
jgi:GGDEF domain-containing protein